MDYLIDKTTSEIIQQYGRAIGKIKLPNKLVVMSFLLAISVYSTLVFIF